MTASKPDTALPIDVHGELRLHGPFSRGITLAAEGPRLNLAVPGWAHLKAMAPGTLRAKLRALATMTAALRTLSLTLNVDVDGQRAFGFGEGVQTTLLARLLGLKSADIRVSTIFRLLRSSAPQR